MLHELLLALSGHASPLLYVPIDKPDDGPFQDLLSPAEAALLKSLANNLGEKHKNVLQHSTIISKTYPSMVCRAVSTAIVSTHVAAFQQKILDVEKEILEENSNLVGAYNIVPLSGLVRAFDGWSRKLEWLWNLVQFIQPVSAKETIQSEASRRPCTASRILDKLRDSTHTGYPDIEQISLDLTKAAEAAWLKQMSTWVLYGRLPTLGTSDVFVTQGSRSKSGSGEATAVYSIDFHLVPEFVTKTTANSILFIGKSLNHIRGSKSGIEGRAASRSSPELELLPSHLAHLSSLKYPINPSSFSAAISAIRLSLSKNALQKLLPPSKVLEVLRVLKDFFLLERGEFAVALISAADERLLSRHNRSVDKFKQKGSEDLSNLIFKDGEIAAVLAKTWTTLLSLQGADDDDADDLDLARELLQLSIKTQTADTPISGSQSKSKSRSKLSDTTFDDFLLPTPTALKLRIPSPLDLLLSSSSVNVYSQINAYLIAIRRGHLRLSQLFLLSPLRRDHPSPKVQTQSQKDRFATLSRMRQRADRRAKTMRPVWATIGSATFLLTELGEYFQGQVIKSSWNAFHAWLDPSSHSHSPPLHNPSSPSSSSTPTPDPPLPTPPHDPESLSHAHKTYLSSLTHSLLLTHPSFPPSLHTFLQSVTHLAALTTRLAAIQLGADDGRGCSGFDFEKEEKAVLEQIMVSKKIVDDGVVGLVRVLRGVDGAAGAADGYAAASASGGGGVGATGKEGNGVDGNGIFIPWGSELGIERLLLKIDWACG